MNKLGNPKTIGFISLSILSNVLVAQNNIPSFLNDEEASTAYIASNHHAGAEGDYIKSNDHDTVHYLIVVDATDHLNNGKVESIGTKTEVPSRGPMNLEKDMELDVVTAINSIFLHHSILFDYNDATLNHSSMKVLDKVAYVILKNPDVVFELGAHTDARGVYGCPWSLR
jgi:outer membrane protein OmpA-like peptidoglycan-associated protein